MTNVPVSAPSSGSESGLSAWLASPAGVLAHLLTGATLRERESESVFERVLGGGFDEAQIGALLALVSARGPTVDELVGGARAMRRHVARVVLPPDATSDARVLDTCGTGGAPKTFNVSTASAFVTAATARDSGSTVYVAKHGSLSRTGRGSAEVLERLGANVHAEPSIQQRCLAEAGVCFCFSVRHHPAMKHAVGPRKSLGFPTIFNLLGPLTNPAGATCQLLGTFSVELSEKMARTLQRLGVDRAMVVHSHDGMDELSTTDTNLVHDVREGVVTTRVIDPERLGLPKTTTDALRVHSLEEAADAVCSTLRGEPGPRTDLVVLNSAGALVVAGVCDDFAAGIDLARQSVNGGSAWALFERFVEASHGR